MSSPVVGTASNRVPMGRFLWQRLYDAGCHHVFGVPGDFSLGLLNYAVKSPCEYVGTCNELNAAYAADGYARLKGLGACVTTYAVGELSALNGVAGSWAESVPVVMIVGAPARRFFTNQPLLHHTLGSYKIPREMYRMITAAWTMLDNPATAASEIDRVLQVALHVKKPVYIVVPSDMVTMPIETTTWATLPPQISDADVLGEAVDEIAAKIAASKNPVLIPGVELIRRNLGGKFKKLVETLRIPFTTMLLSKCICDEVDEYFIGLYAGNRSRQDVRDIVHNSDCVVIFGEYMTDFNTGGFTANVDPASRIFITADSVQVSRHSYAAVEIVDVMDAMIQKVKPFPEDYFRHYSRARDGCVHRQMSMHEAKPTDKLTMNRLFEKMSHWIPENSVVIAETGSSLFAAAETQMPKGTVFIGQTFYGSIGYSVGSCLGACVAAKGTNRKVILFVGDGSFQVTAQDLSTMVRYNCSPVIFLINNDGYLIERVIYDNTYNDIQMWKYADLPTTFGSTEKGKILNTEADLESALDQANQHPDKMHFLETVLDKWDCNDLLKNAGATMARNNDLHAC